VLERELELLGAGALGGLLKRKAKHMHAVGTPCANCQTELQGPYCHVCGQSSDDQHRSILHLMWEGIEGLTHLDGRLGQTLPPLFLSPGKLAKDHFEGRRQRHVPPFRLFLISLLVFMFVLEGLFHGAKEHKAGEGKPDPIATAQQKFDAKMRQKAAGHPAAAKPDADKDDEAKDAGDKSKDKVIVVGPSAMPHVSFKSGLPKGGKLSIINADVNGKAIDPNNTKAMSAALGDDDSGWLAPRLKKALDNKEYYLMVLFTWAHRLAILLLPILAGLLAMVYFRRRQFFIYDHLIVSMQFLSFVFLISAIAWIIPDPVRGFAVFVASVWVPINLYQTLRGAYGSKWYTAVIKAAFLWTATLFLFSFLMAGLMTLALAEMA